MKYLDEFRAEAHCQALLAQITSSASRNWRIMEVCGGQTHSLLRYGIEEELRGVVELLHGPGCPVCVTPVAAIDYACQLAQRDGVLLTSFGDMLRVPGSCESLLSVRARGANVRMVYSPLDAVQLAARDRERQVVFLAVGFETTAPATALAVRQAAALSLANFSLLVSHVRVEPAMELLATEQNSIIDGFLAAGHVCTVAGYAAYEEMARRIWRPIVVTGFEPVDLLLGTLECIRLLEAGRAELVNAYARCVAREGNLHARKVVQEVFEPCNAPWRGMGTVPGGGLRLRDEWSRFDAERRFGACGAAAVESSECRSGDVLRGLLKPTACPAFGTRCTPDRPLGAPMVSSEGACAAYFRFQLAPAAPAQTAEGPHA